MADPTLEQTIRDTISRWQEQLLQLDRRNGLLYLKETGNVVPIRTQSIDAFLDKLTGKRGGLKFPYADNAVRRPRQPRVGDPIPDPSNRATAPGGGEPVVEPGDIDVDIDVVRLQRILTGLRRRDREFTEEQGVNVLFLAAGLLDWTDEDNERGLAPLVMIPCDLDRATVRDHF